MRDTIRLTDVTYVKPCVKSYELRMCSLINESDFTCYYYRDAMLDTIRITDVPCVIHTIRDTIQIADVTCVKLYGIPYVYDF
jgi:hypothetical protein